MKSNPILCILLTTALILILAGCNFPSAATATNTALPASPNSAPTATAVPPTPAPPSETPTELPPTATIALPSPEPFTPEPSQTPTQTVIQPEPGALFEGTFENSILQFRISKNGQEVIPKMIRVRKASCREGGTITTLLAFDPPPSFPITDGQFVIARDKQIYWTGIFTSARNARGSIELHLGTGGKNCTVGPVSWYATIQ
ncbi:MAG: hypothetical protein JXB15_00870 [Anaerolineales bacterium]|nr:hypothetical protein [Anaerolineales bacterium]